MIGESPELLLRRAWDAGAPRPVAAALTAASWAYRLALVARSSGYAVGALRTGRLPCPVVSVGNLTLGGSGKTPLAELVALALRRLGAMPALVSRGYGRKSRGVRIVADGSGIQAGPLEAGDEPLLLAERLPGVPVVVGENRLAAGRVAIERCGATAIVLDDGYQHRTLAKDLDLLVVNGQAPWGNGRLFPRGTLREPLPAIGRASFVVVSEPPDAGALDRIVATVRRHNPAVPVAVGRIEALAAEDKWRGERLPPAGLAGRRLLAFAGLGRPQGFLSTLQALGVLVAGAVEFPDHHWFTPQDLADLVRRGRAAGAEGLVTTEKDWVRLRGFPLGGPLWVLSTRLRLTTGEETLVATLGRLVSRAPAPRA